MNGAGSGLALGFLLLLTTILGVLLGVQWNQRRQLRQWLDHPEQGDPPDGIGGWRGIFSRLQQLRKEERTKYAALSSDRDRFRQAVETLPDGVILLDGNGHIDWLNDEAARHFGLNAQRDGGTLIEQLIRDGTFIAHLIAFRAGEPTAPLVITRNSKDHVRQTLSIDLLSVADGGCLLLSRDITEISRAETTRRDFIANVSHELRTPLTVIAGFLEQMTGDTPPTGNTAQHFLRLMDEQARRMTRLVEDLLTLSSLENATEPPREERVDVPALVSALLQEAQALSAGRHVIELDTVAECHLLGSPDELRSAFSNLITNAIRYTPSGGRITISWTELNGSPTFSVTDTGIGIPLEHIPRLSERFYRVDKGRSTNTGGTGLGLAIVKHVLARHQGSLLIHSEVGRGSRFSAQLPATRAIPHKVATAKPRH